MMSVIWRLPTAFVKKAAVLQKIAVYLLTVCLLAPLVADNAFAAKGPGRNRAPVVNDQSFNINENSANGTVVGTVVASDPDGNTLTYSITAGNTNNAFAISASAGTLTVANSAALDFETTPVFSLTVRVADPGGLSDTAIVTVNLNDVNETPTGAANGKIIFQSMCSGCHMHGRGDHLGPDLKNRGGDNFTRQFIADPQAMIDRNNARAVRLYATWGYVMPKFNLTSAQIEDVLAFLRLQDSLGPLYPSAPVALTPTQFEQARNVYFNRCAGCHGLYRTGATGPNIGEARAEWIGTEGLGALLRHGTPRGMPNFGTSGVVSEAEITLLASFLQDPPPTPPSLSMAEIQASWNLIVPVASRPTTPQRANWENIFGVVERDAGKISLFDGGTYALVARLDVGFAVHILRSSASGRYFYAIGRDGLVSLIDLWSSTPTIVATVKGCHDARSVDGSKFAGYEDQYIVEGCYWPPQYVVYNGLTLEPLARNDLPMQSITGETLPEVRVAAIAASHHNPIWALALKESGYVALVDYSQPGFPIAKNIATEKFLHDGGWDHTGRYFLIAANASNKMVAVDMQTQTMAASFSTGGTPHPGRGANWQDPVYGWVNATPHIGEGKVSIYGADPVGRPDVAWKVVREIVLPSAGSLFLKTHPNSAYVLFDMTLSTTDAKQVCAYKKSTGALDRCFAVATNGVATHFEFNQAGTEIWVSDWASDGAVVVLDGTTLAEKRRITGLVTPTGKFNVYNTAHDVY